ncbi:hypothetical protein PUNSTDRAFT_52461 [Punctularia strigosozonata HHB-11173 SS5]|uniref:uncharacterized protein n=1 Tax=Punctularia strigosozonata (strain HHB-11173) TaxID=741275 RepID=UPI00044167E0|nr:uncharacterized protein PUNSTDRAFT_52461 [Punctularia strigosozonata HHB-11173 SS5]EIN09057.1 hypothetical protein PUNSTDRAFT_52461 [Punctularia strigosozonata HHB-11173 SS5]
MSSYTTSYPASPSPSPFAAASAPSPPFSPSSTPPPTGDRFAFARVKGTVCLVQLPDDASLLSPLTPPSLSLFRHEFGTIFRFAASRAVHPSELRVLEPVPADLVRYEPDSGQAFLARGCVARLAKLTMANNNVEQQQQYAYAGQRRGSAAAGGSGRRVSRYSTSTRS